MCRSFTRLTTCVYRNHAVVRYSRFGPLLTAKRNIFSAHTLGVVGRDHRAFYNLNYAPPLQVATSSSHAFRYPLAFPGGLRFYSCVISFFGRIDVAM